MTFLNKVLVFAEDAAAWPELCSGGRQLAKEITAIIIGSKESAESAASYGAKAYWLGDKEQNYLLEDYTAQIAKIISEEKPNLVLVRTSKRVRAIAGRLGVRLKAGVVADALEIQADTATTVKVKHLVYGGAAIRTVKPVTPIAIVLVGSGVFEITASPVMGEVIAVKATLPEKKCTCVESRPREVENVDLGAAKRVVGVGRGLAKQEDLAQVQQLAAALGAEMACSRPIAEGENWMPRSRYLGVSGAIIKPDLYLAVGISGQVQHLVGVSGARTIVAINKDKNAPIFQHADYGIVGDLYTVIPELLKILKSHL